MSAARRMKAPVSKATPRVAKTKAKGQGNSTDARLPCALSTKGCKKKRTQHSIFCYGHGRRIDVWAGRPEWHRKERLQDLDRWSSFVDHDKGAS